MYLSASFSYNTITLKKYLAADVSDKKNWSQFEETGYVVSRVIGTNLTDGDIVSLDGNKWLTDQVCI